MLSEKEVLIVNELMISGTQIVIDRRLDTIEEYYIINNDIYMLSYDKVDSFEEWLTYVSREGLKNALQHMRVARDVLKEDIYINEEAIAELL